MEKEKGLTVEEIRKDLELTLLQVGALKGELVEVNEKLKKQRTAVWATLFFTESHYRELSKLFDIKGDRARVRCELKKMRAEAKRLNSALIEIGNKRFRLLNGDDSADDDDDDDYDYEEEEEFEDGDEDEDGDEHYQQELLDGFGSFFSFEDEDEFPATNKN